MKRRVAIGLGITFALAIVVAIIYLNRGKGWIWPVTGRVSDAYGKRTHPITGAVESFHNGIDIAAPEGTRIVAPARGKVASIFNHATGGKSMILEHPNGYHTGYAHLSGYYVSQGEEVEQGQAIAMVGQTGSATGAHLHFTMTKPNGAKVDPQTLLA